MARFVLRDMTFVLKWLFSSGLFGNLFNEQATTKAIALVSAPSNRTESHFALSWDCMLGGAFYERLSDETRTCYICK